MAHLSLDGDTSSCPTTYHAMLIRYFQIRSLKRIEANTEIQSSNILRSNIRTYLEGHGVFRYHFLYSKIRRLEDGTSHLYTVKDITEKCFCFMIELIH